ncbi:uncharacterized protein LOC128983170 [Macrosteles quadrilineatus]|uniref:uncharacterized protein LOC128983170 n=1 Tax=Macrosteles quadrilineatus TaxID=74068 RepID=UPI0023E10548|nr:uncharacterized protein LOC128983170 [Macrosteles quadrilineatus]
MIFDDLHKLFLYQKLNLGFECQLCKQKFYNRNEHLEHSRICQKVPDLKCTKCGKTFGHVRILQLHMQFHNVSESLGHQSPEKESTTVSETTTLSDNGSGSSELKANSKHIREEIKTDVKTINKTTATSTSCVGSVDGKNSMSNSFKILELSEPKKKSSPRTKVKPKPAKKQVGLTKIRMEDCLRCDACSCIYIDEKDYYKHMRNFHHKDVNKTPTKQQRSKRKCQSCCKQCRGSHCLPVKRPRATQPSSNLIFRFSMKDNIKNRWSKMLSQQLTESSLAGSTPGLCEPELVNIKSDLDRIKQEPEPDLSYLLSQVEVKIKTEPPDDY